MHLAQLAKSNDEWLARCQMLFMEENSRLGQQARDTREALGVSARAFAKLMGVSAMMLSDLERGRRVWNANLTSKWEAAFKQTL